MHMRCPVVSEVSGGVFGCVGNEENRPVARPAHTQALHLLGGLKI